MNFVIRRTLEDSVNLQKTTDDFLNTVKPVIEQFGSENIYNSDQSGFQLEIYSGRSLSNQGIKKVQCVVQSLVSTTYSYTIQPIILCDGNLLSPLFIVLKETNGRFRPKVEKNLFRPTNIIIKASQSDKTSGINFFITFMFYLTIYNNRSYKIASKLTFIFLVDFLKCS